MGDIHNCKAIKFSVLSTPHVHKLGAHAYHKTEFTICVSPRFMHVSSR